MPRAAAFHSERRRSDFAPGWRSQLILETQNLSSGYGESPVLAGLDLSIEAGEFVAVLGPNGCGKTTLLKTVAKLLQPLSGRILLDGRDLAQIPVRELARTIGVVPQDDRIDFDFTVLDIVAMGRLPHIGRWEQMRPRDDEIVEQAMRMTGVWELRRRSVLTLSGGERKRVIIARALAQEPRLLLLDEPTSNLDINYQHEIMALLHNMNRDSGLTVAVVLHDLNLAAEFARRLVLLSPAGKVHCDGPPSAVITREHVLAVYSVSVCVTANPLTGVPQVMFAAPARARRALRVHVVCGGGTAHEILPRLVREGFEVTVGVLSQGDSDLERVHLLGLEHVAEVAMSEIGDAAAARNAALMAAADAIVVSDVPFGPGNLRNLVAAVESGKPVALVRPDTLAERDFTSGGAAGLLAQLANQQRVTAVNGAREIVTWLGSFDAASE